MPPQETGNMIFSLYPGFKAAYNSFIVFALNL
jgi:hypothetical protein